MTNSIIAPDLAVDVDAALVFNYKIASGATVNGLQQPIANDGDFFLCGIKATSGLFVRPDDTFLNSVVGLRFSDGTGYKLSSDFLNVYFFSPSYGNNYHYPILPAHPFKAGTRINIDIQELTASGSPSIVQIVFVGRYRYRTAEIARQAMLSQGKGIRR